jgi:hypothetical protein
MGFRAAALVLLLAIHPSPAPAQAAAPITLLVSQGGKEIGREVFTLSQGRGRGAPGMTLSATARYPASTATTRLTAVLEWTPEFAIAKFQLDLESPEGSTVILAAGSLRTPRPRRAGCPRQPRQRTSPPRVICATGGR